jgi:ketosteroid isomerase-like protein
MALTADDKFEILDLIARYNLTADEKDVEGMLGCYTDDGVIEGDMSTGKGKDAMRVDLPRLFAMEGTLKRHLVMNHRISGDGERAEVRYLLLVIEGESIPAVGASTQVCDELRKEGGRWLVARHSLKIDPAMYNAIKAQGGG